MARVAGPTVVNVLNEGLNLKMVMLSQSAVRPFLARAVTTMIERRG